MAMSNNGLDKVCEEAAELIQVAAKMIAQPHNPDVFNLEDLKYKFIEEAGDTIASIQFALQKLNLEESSVSVRAHFKLRKYQQWDEFHG